MERTWRNSSAVLARRSPARVGSHVRLIRSGHMEHRVTIPAHGTLKIGTLNSILKDIAGHLAISKDELVQELWGTGE